MRHCYTSMADQIIKKLLNDKKAKIIVPGMPYFARDAQTYLLNSINDIFESMGIKEKVILENNTISWEENK